MFDVNFDWEEFNALAGLDQVKDDRRDEAQMVWADTVKSPDHRRGLQGPLEARLPTTSSFV